jgi:hypothetical protein
VGAIWLGIRSQRPTAAWEIELGRAVSYERNPSPLDRLVTVVGGDGPPLVASDEGLLLRPWHANLEWLDRAGDVFLHVIPAAVWDDLAAGCRDTWGPSDHPLNIGTIEEVFVAARREDLPPSQEQQARADIELFRSWADVHGSLVVPHEAEWHGRRIGTLLHNLNILAQLGELSSRYHPDDLAELQAVPGWPGRVTSEP